MNGLIKEMSGLIGIIGGFFVASHSATSASEIFLPIENAYLRLLLGFILSFLIFWLCIHLISMVITKLFKISGLGIFDSIGGFLFGFLKAFFIFSIIVYFITKIEFLNDRINKVMANSFMYPLLKQNGNFIMTNEDIQLQKKIDITVDEIKKDISQTSTKIITNEAGKQIKDIAKNVAKIIKEQTQNEVEQNNKSKKANKDNN
jgi:membrane protein required for colicin V production